MTTIKTLTWLLVVSYHRLGLWTSLQGHTSVI